MEDQAEPLIKSGKLNRVLEDWCPPSRRRIDSCKTFTNALIALDKQWGESGAKGETTVARKLLADEVVSVTAGGVRGERRRAG